MTNVVHAYPETRVFIFGVEVTHDLVDWSTEKHDNRAPGTANITLINRRDPSQDDRYLFRAKDMRALYTDLRETRVSVPELAPTFAAATAQALAFRSPDAPVSDPVRKLVTGYYSAEEVADIVDSLDPETQKAVASEVAERTGYFVRANHALDHVNQQILERIETSIRDPIKARVLARKLSAYTRVVQPSVSLQEALRENPGEWTRSSPRAVAALSGLAPRYDLHADDPIFTTNDAVRVFERDPLAENVWYYGFSGFITDWEESEDAQGVSMLRLTCEDVMRPFRYARFTTNPAIFDIDKAAVAQDFIVRTFGADDTGFRDLNLEEILYTVLFGPERADTLRELRGALNDDFAEYRSTEENYGVNGVTRRERPLFGVGNFNFERSSTFLYGLGSLDTADTTARDIQTRRVYIDGDNALGLYQAALDWRVRAGDLESTVLAGETPISTAGMVKDENGAPLIDEVITAIGENPQLYPPDAQRFVMLLPASLGSDLSRQILSQDILKTVATKATNWRTRLDVVCDVAERLNFSFYATPRGDLVLEMPLYDFDPESFGTEPITFEALRSAIFDGGLRRTPENRLADFGISLGEEEVAGPYAPQFTLPDFFAQNVSRLFSDEQVRNQFFANYNILPWAGPTSEDVGLTQVSTLRSLIPRFGVRQERVDPQIYIQSAEAARAYGYLRLNQINADALQLSYESFPPPGYLGIGPNRPLKVPKRSVIATTRRLGYSSAQVQSLSCSITLNYARRWSGQVDENGDPVYEPLGGFAGRPLNYALLLQSLNVRSTRERPGEADIPSAQDNVS